MEEDAVNLEIFVTVQGGTSEQMARAMEKLTTVATGLALEGLRVTINITTDDDDYEDVG